VSEVVSSFEELPEAGAISRFSFLREAVRSSGIFTIW
jgi:hypothetical protein